MIGVRVMVVVVEVVGAGASEAAVATAVEPFTTSHLQHQNCILCSNLT